MVTLAGVGRDYPPNDEAAFLDFAGSLRSPILYQAIRTAQPLTPISTYRRTENQSAVALDQWLRHADSALAFQRALGKTVATPWLLATGEDFRFPSTEGGRPGLMTRLAHRYFDRLLEVSTADETVAQTFLRVLHLLDPPSVLFAPPILARAARGPRRPLLSAPPTATPLGTAVGQPV